MNPGPSMIKAMVGRLTTPPPGTARHAKATTDDTAPATNGASTAVTPVIATSKIKTTNVAAAAATPAANEEPAKKAPTPRKPAPKTNAAPATPPVAEKRRGIGAVIWG
jgi:hypothetical protein